MEGTCDSVPSLTIVVENIYSSCDLEGNDAVSVSTLIDFLRPLMSNHPDGLVELQQILDPNNENPLIGKISFYEAMQKWTSNIDGNDSRLSNFSLRESESFMEKELPFHQSTPKPSMSPSAMKYVSNILNVQNISPTSFSNSSKNNTAVGCDTLFLEEKVRELEHKYMNALEELKMVKVQLAQTEEQYADIKLDLDRTNKRLLSEQQVNADLQKSLEHNDDFKEKEIISTKKEIEHLQKMWSIAKKENLNLIASIKDLEFEKEKLDKKNNEILKRENQKKKELVDLQIILSHTEEENKTLKNRRNELEKKLDEKNDLLKHFSELSEELKNENKILKTVIKKAGITDINVKDTPNFSDPGNETVDDLDLTGDLVNLATKGQDLLSEFQECKFLDNRDKCFVQDHADLYKIAKEHENCTKIISEHQKELRLSVNDLNLMEADRNTILAKYKCMEKDAKIFEKLLNDHKVENDKLRNEKDNIEKEVLALNKCVEDQEKELAELREIKVKFEETSKQCEEISKINDEKDSELKELEKEYEILVNENRDIQNQISQKELENQGLVDENNNFRNIIDEKDKELNELNRVRIENCDLLEEITNMKLEQEKNCNDVEKLTKKLEECNVMGKNFVATIKSKITNQNTKVEFLRNYNDKLKQYVEEAQEEIENTKSKLAELKITIDNSLIKTAKTDESTTSRDSSETELTYARPEFKRRSTGTKRSNYEKQQNKIDKLEERIEILKEELSTEKTKSQRICALEFHINNLQLEKVNFMEERSSLLRELEAIKYNISLKDQMMEQFEEKYKFELENLNVTFRKEKELTNLLLITKEREAEENMNVLQRKIDELEITLEHSKQERQNLETLLDKQVNNIVSLKKALLDVTDTAEKAKSFEDIVIEKESMLKFNRELLTKSNNNLKNAEDRILSLELMLDKCKMVLFETARDVFRDAKLACDAWKHSLKNKKNDDYFNELESLHDENRFSQDELTEQEIWKINNRLILSAKLLRILAKKANENKKKENRISKSISKFTLKPSKLKLDRLPSSDPDITSSSVKESDSQYSSGPTIDTDIDKEVISTSIEHITPLRENDSVTDWLGDRVNNLRTTLNNRKVTEKKFCILSLTWKTKYQKTKAKYLGFKENCAKLRNTYLRTLLQIVNYIKGHKCQREQKSLIQALKLFENLKDLMFDVFKLAGQYGASRQELHSMKCWNLIVDYVNGVHLENEKLKLFRCTSVQMINESPRSFCDVSSETDSFDQPSQSTFMEASSNTETETKEIVLVEPKKLSPYRMFQKKCSTFMMTILSMFILLIALWIYLHLECLRKVNGSIVCPLDFLITEKRNFPPH